MTATLTDPTFSDSTRTTNPTAPTVASVAARPRPPRLPRPGRRDRTRQVLVGQVPLDQVEAHPSNIRRNLGDLRDLTDSITTYGVMHPVVLENLGHGRLRVRAGHRRVAAARLAGLTRIPAVVHPDALDDDEWLIHAAHENTRRRDLDRTDTLRTYQLLRDAGVTKDAAAAALGRTPQTLAAWAANGIGRGTRPPGARVQRGALARLVEEFRARPDATTTDLLNALDHLLTGAPATAATPTPGTGAADTSATAAEARRAA